MALHDRLSRLESLLSPQAPEPWTTWTQSHGDRDIFCCTVGPDAERGTAAHRLDLEGRPRAVLIEYVVDEGTGEPATVMHQPNGVTRRLVGVGRDEMP